jgi:phospholipid transport system transporter-binding protein
MGFAPTTMTMSDAATAMQDGVEAIRRGMTTIDLTHLTHFDSSAVSTLVAWQRAAAEKSVNLQLVGLPAGLHSLAQLYGVDVLL